MADPGLITGDPQSALTGVILERTREGEVGEVGRGLESQAEKVEPLLVTGEGFKARPGLWLGAQVV